MPLLWFLLLFGGEDEEDDPLVFAEAAAAVAASISGKKDELLNEGDMGPFASHVRRISISSVDRSITLGMHMSVVIDLCVRKNDGFSS